MTPSYAQVLRGALYTAVMQILKGIPRYGLPRDHSVALSFCARHDGAVFPSDLVAEGGELSLVLDASIKYIQSDDDGVTIENTQGHFYVPFVAITRFLDQKNQVGFEIPRHVPMLEGAKIVRFDELRRPKEERCE